MNTKLLIFFLSFTFLFSCKKATVSDDPKMDIDFNFSIDNSSPHTPIFNYDFYRTDNFGNASTSGNNVPGARKLNTSEPRVQWDFGDGIRSTDQNPYHIWNSSGVYKVILTVSRLVSFAGIFSSDSIGTWDFGDGSPKSNQRNPQHNYIPGSYTAKLIVGNQIVTKSIVVSNVGSNSMDINIKADEVVKSIPNTNPNKSGFTVTYTSLSTGIETAGFGKGSYLWNFGDGSTATTSSPSHTYSTSGNYNVKLTVTGWGGFTKNESSFNISVP